LREAILEKECDMKGLKFQWIAPNASLHLAILSIRIKFAQKRKMFEIYIEKHPQKFPFGYILSKGG
jgi:hypothetical protein